MEGTIPSNPNSSVSVDYYPRITRRCCNKMPGHLSVSINFENQNQKENLEIVLLYVVATSKNFLHRFGPFHVKVSHLHQIENGYPSNHQDFPRKASILSTFRPTPSQRGQRRSSQSQVRMEAPSKGRRSQSLLARVEVDNTSTLEEVPF